MIGNSTSLTFIRIKLEIFTILLWIHIIKSFLFVLKMILPNNIDTVWVEETRMHRHKHTRSTQITWKFEKGRGEKGTQEEKEDAN